MLLLMRLWTRARGLDRTRPKTLHLSITSNPVPLKAPHTIKSRPLSHKLYVNPIKPQSPQGLRCDPKNDSVRLRPGDAQALGMLTQPLQVGPGFVWAPSVSWFRKRVCIQRNSTDLQTPLLQTPSKKPRSVPKGYPQGCNAGYGGLLNRVDVRDEEGRCYCNVQWTVGAGDWNFLRPLPVPTAVLHAKGTSDWSKPLLKLMCLSAYMNIYIYLSTHVHLDRDIHDDKSERSTTSNLFSLWSRCLYF